MHILIHLFVSTFPDNLYICHVWYFIFNLQLLRCIHALWKDQITCNLSEEIEKAKVLLNCEEDYQQNGARELLDQIRESW